MGALQRFERRLENLISGVFARAFRSAVQPVEIAAALQREVDNNAQILSRDRRLVPNDFHVELARTDLDRLAPYDNAMARDMTASLHGVRPAAELRVPRPGHHPLRGRRRPDHRPVPGPQRGQGQRDRRGQPHARSAPPAPTSRSTAPGTRCARPGWSIGRGTEAHVRINDPGVSRQHVEFNVVATGAAGDADGHLRLQRPRPRLDQRR